MVKKEHIALGLGAATVVGLAAYFLSKKEGGIGAGISAVTLSQTTIAPDTPVTISVTFQNTGQVDWTFGVGATFMDPLGGTHDVPNTPVAVHLAIGRTTTTSIQVPSAFLHQEGIWKLRVSIWKQPQVPLQDRLADTGFKDAITVVGGPSAQIISVSVV